MSSEPEYEKYSRGELIDVYENIDRENYPKRFKKVVRLLGLKDKHSDIFIGLDDNEEEPYNPELNELNKTRRINDFFDSLSDTNSEYHSDSYGSCDFGGGDGGSGDCSGLIQQDTFNLR